MLRVTGSFMSLLQSEAHKGLCCLLMGILIVCIASGILSFATQSSKPSLAAFGQACSENLQANNVSTSGSNSNHAADNDFGTKWSTSGTRNAWIIADLGSQKAISYADIAWHKGNSKTYDFAIAASSDKTNYVELYKGQSSGTTRSFECYDFADVEARYMKITVGKSSGASGITELDIFGSSTTTTSVVDTTRPSVSITSPENGSSVTLGSAIRVRGTASDSSGIKKVEAFIHGTPFNYEWPFFMATPKAVGDWSAWSIDLQAPELGTNRILARATDSVGNQNWYEVHVNVLASQPSESIDIIPYDDFNGGNYILAQGDTSPNGKWYGRWNGYGEMGVNTEPDGRASFYQKVRSATDPSVINPDQTTSGTHSALALSTQKFGNAEISMDIKTVQQLATRDPNTWETAWIFWRSADDTHHYFFMLKTNGYNFGKKDTNDNAEDQVFLKTGSYPYAELGKWYNVKIRHVGEHVTIWVDGNVVVDMDDPTYNASQMSSGAIGLYNEDAYVRFDNVYVKPL
jgi:hypothetical protein